MKRVGYRRSRRQKAIAGEEAIVGSTLDKRRRRFWMRIEHKDFRAQL